MMVQKIGISKALPIRAIWCKLSPQVVPMLHPPKRRLFHDNALDGFNNEFVFSCRCALCPGIYKVDVVLIGDLRWVEIFQKIAKTR